MATWTVQCGLIGGELDNGAVGSRNGRFQAPALGILCCIPSSGQGIPTSSGKRTSSSGPAVQRSCMVPPHWPSATLSSGGSPECMSAYDQCVCLHASEVSLRVTFALIGLWQARNLQDGHLDRDIVRSIRQREQLFCCEPPVSPWQCVFLSLGRLHHLALRTPTYCLRWNPTIQVVQRSRVSKSIVAACVRLPFRL